MVPPIDCHRVVRKALLKDTCLLKWHYHGEGGHNHGGEASRNARSLAMYGLILKNKENLV